MPDATLPNPRRPVRLENSLAPGTFLCFQAQLVAPRPRTAQKNAHVCVLNPASTVPEQGAFANPQVDGLQGFGLLPPAELKRKHTLFLRAGITVLGRQSPDRTSPAGLFRIPRVHFHVGHIGNGEERHGKARVLACIVVLIGKREKRSDRPAQIRLFTTQFI